MKRDKESKATPAEDSGSGAEGERMKEVGPLPLRAAVGDGARGLQRERRRLELLQPRPGAVARVPLGRGRQGVLLLPRFDAHPLVHEYLYKYPQAAYPYADLIEGNRSRGREEAEYELLDTGVFEGGA